MNTLHITDMHIQMLSTFNDMLETKRIQEFFKRLEYWLNIKNNTDNTINIYLWGDMFNYLSFSNIDTCIISWYWHLFLIKKFLEEKNLSVKNIYYVLWNHEYYVDKRWSEKPDVRLEDKDVIKIIEKEINQIKETLKYLKDESKINDENEKMKYLEQYLPEEMSEDEVKKILTELIEKNNIDTSKIGDVMKIAKENNLPLNIVNKILRG